MPHLKTKETDMNKKTQIIIVLIVVLENGGINPVLNKSLIFVLVYIQYFLISLKISVISVNSISCSFFIGVNANVNP